MLLWYIFCWRYNQDLMPDERCGEAGEEGSKVSISVTPPPSPNSRAQVCIINLEVKIYRKTNLGFSCWAMKVEINWHVIISPTKVTERAAVEHKTGRKVAGWGSGGFGEALHDLAPRKKRENRARLQKWRRLRRRGCARQTLPAVGLKCYCKVTCKVPGRQGPLPPSHLPTHKACFQSLRPLAFFGQGCNAAALRVESKQCPVSSYLTPSNCQLTQICYSYVC